MKLSFFLKLLLGTGVMGLITFSIKDTGMVFVFSLFVFVVLLIVVVLVLFSEISGFTNE